MSNCALQPYNKRLLILQDKPREKTGSGIIITQASQEPPCKWTILAVSKDISDEFKPGDKIFCPSFCGISPQLDEDDLPSSIRDRVRLITRDEVMGVFPS